MKISPEKLQKAREYVVKHKNINWYSDQYKLDEKAIVEGILNYGSWDDFLQISSLIGQTLFKNIFEDISDSSRMRINLRPRTINFFHNYFKKHV